MQDFIPRKIDINQKIDEITVKQFDNDSRYLKVTISDIDLTDTENTAFDLSDCSAALYMQPEGSEDEADVQFVAGTVESAASGEVSFLLPGGVTQNVGRYECEIWIYQGDEQTRPVISTKSFTLIVEKSIKNDSAIEATQDMSALNAKMVDIQTVKNQMAAIMAMADAGEIPAGTVEAEVTASRVGWNGAMGYNSEAGAFQFGSTEYSSLAAALAGQVGKLRDMGLIYLGTFLNSQTWDTVTLDGSRTFAGLPNNVFAVCNTVEAVNPISDAPVSGPMNGYIFTFGRADKDYRRNFDTQVFMQKDRVKIWARVYDGSAWSAWCAIGGSYLEDSIDGIAGDLATVPQFRSGVNDSFAEKNYLISNITDDGTFFASQTASVNGSTVTRWTDLPTDNQNFIITNSRYSTNSILQTAIPTDTLTPVYSRIIPRPGISYTVKPWSTYSGIDPRKKILAVGDSICAGWRNSGKGFVGDLGLPYQNKGLPGTTMSDYLDGTIGGEDKTCIPQQLARVTGYQPDIIIANGGHNDYNYSVPMGDIPEQPATDINTLDASTVMGGLQRLFLTMIQNYPSAERYFVTTHKIYRNASSDTDKNGYLPTKKNSVGYTETDLHDAIVQCCNVYNVKVIDVFNDSPINSMYSVYRGQYYYGSGADNPSGTSAETDLTHYFDKDGVHPLAKGYLEGYIPLIREALKGSQTGSYIPRFVNSGKISEAVSEWLNAHPEATTTVQDGSVTKSKFAAALASEIDGKADSIKLAFVTPEMFGAVGNGVTDDYQAIQDCVDYAFAHNARVEFARKTYAVSDTVKLYSKCVYNGNNCTILQTSDVPTMATYKYFDDSKGAHNVTINDFWLEGDTNNINNDGLIICGWFARVNNVNVRNVGGHGIVITTYSSEGNEFSGTTMVEGMICNSMGKSVNQNKYPFYVHCRDVVITDWRVENCIFAAADAPAFMMMERISGWFLTDVQCYGKAEYGIRSSWASGTQIENVILDGVSYAGIAINDQLGSTNISNININVRPEVTDNFIAIKQVGGSGRPALLSVINIHVNVPAGTTPARLILQSGSAYIFDVTNPSFMQNHAELDYELYSYKGNTDVYRLNGFEVIGNKPNSDILPTLAKHYTMERYTATSETLTLTIAPPYPIKRGGLLVIIGEVNGDSKGNSVYSIGLMRRGTNQPCRLVSEQTGYEFTNVGVTFDSATNTYTISATTPSTSNCTYSMNVIF